MDKEKYKFKPGDVTQLRVARVSELGAFLDAGTGNTSDDILLHQAQQLHEVADGDTVEVYLYLDPKGRMAASMRLPKMKEGQVARVTVINTTRDGAFVDIGAERGVFLPFSQMRGRPRKGDKVWVKLYRDKSGRPAVSMKVENELRQAAKPATDINPGDIITGSVYNETDLGMFLFTKERHIAFLHNDEMTIRPKMGEEISARVTYLREDGRVNVTQRPLKQEAMDSDAEKILAMLRTRNGQIPYGDDTTPEVIKVKFGISKGAFKRALGKLIKCGAIRQEEGWTYLLKDPVETEE